MIHLGSVPTTVSTGMYYDHVFYNEPLLIGRVVYDADKVRP